MENLKTVYFDMGNTLLHFHEGPSDAEKDREGFMNLCRSLRKFSRKLTRERIETEFYVPWQNCLPRRATELVEFPIEDFLSDFTRRYGLELEPNQVLSVMESYYSPYSQNVRVRDGVEATLARLKNKGYKLGVISNCHVQDEIMIGCFARAGLDPFIDAYTFSYSLRVRKPREEIFFVALNRLDSMPSESLMVGDSLTADVAGAHHLGMKTIWLNPGLKDGEYPAFGPEVDEPDFTIASIPELGKLLIG